MSVIGPHEDICNARLTFENGCVANLTASRLALKTERKLRVFSPDAYVSLDYQKKYGIVVRRSGNLDAVRDAAAKIRAGEITDLSQLNYADLVQVEELQIDDVEPARAQLESFIAAVRGEMAPVVSAEDGLAAVELATRIVESMTKSRTLKYSCSNAIESLRAHSRPFAHCDDTAASPCPARSAASAGVPGSRRPSAACSGAAPASARIAGPAACPRSVSGPRGLRMLVTSASCDLLELGDVERALLLDHIRHLAGLQRPDGVSRLSRRHRCPSAASRPRCRHQARRGGERRIVCLAGELFEVRRSIAFSRIWLAQARAASARPPVSLSVRGSILMTRNFARAG